MDTVYIILMVGGLLLLIGVIAYEMSSGAAPAPTTGTAAPDTAPTQGDSVPVSNIADVTGATNVSSGTSADTVYQAAGLASTKVISSGGYTLTNSATGVLNITDSTGATLWTIGTADNQAKTLTVSPSGQAVYKPDTGTNAPIALNTGASTADSYYLKLGADGSLAVWKTGAATPNTPMIFSPSTTPANNYQVSQSSGSYGPSGGDSLFQNGSLAPGQSISTTSGGKMLTNTTGTGLVLTNGTYPGGCTFKDSGTNTYTINQFGQLVRTSSVAGVLPVALNGAMPTGKYFLQVASVPDPSDSTATGVTLKMLPFDVAPTASNTYVFYQPAAAGSAQNVLLMGQTIASGASILSPSGEYKLYNNVNGSLQFMYTSSVLWTINLVGTTPMIVSVNSNGQVLMTSSAKTERLNRASSDPGVFSIVIGDDGTFRVVNNTTKSTFFQVFPEPNTNSVPRTWPGPSLRSVPHQQRMDIHEPVRRQRDSHPRWWARGQLSSKTDDGTPRKVFMANSGQMMVRGAGKHDIVYGPSFAANDYMLELTSLGHLQTIDQAGNTVYTIYSP